MAQTRSLTLSELHAMIHSGRAAAIRVRHGLTQSDIAADIDVAPATISRWEGKLRRPRGDAAVRYAVLLRKLEARPSATPGGEQRAS